MAAGARRGSGIPHLVGSWVVLVAFGWLTLRALNSSPLSLDVDVSPTVVIVGLVYPIVLSSIRVRIERRARALVPSALTTAQQDEAVYAARRGPLPDDPGVRAEARRIAEQWWTSVGSTLGRNALILGALAAGCAVAGLLWSAWWWGMGALLGGTVVLTLWRRHRGVERLVQLRREVVMPAPPRDGVHRLVEGEVVTDLADSGRGLLTLDVHRPWGGGSSLAAVVVRVDDAVVPSALGSQPLRRARRSAAGVDRAGVVAPLRSSLHDGHGRRRSDHAAALHAAEHDLARRRPRRTTRAPSGRDRDLDRCCRWGRRHRRRRDRRPPPLGRVS